MENLEAVGHTINIESGGDIDVAVQHLQRGPHASPWPSVHLWGCTAHGSKGRRAAAAAAAVVVVVVKIAAAISS